jgi:hypothetical protein
MVVRMIVKIVQAILEGLGINDAGDVLAVNDDGDTLDI